MDFFAVDDSIDLKSLHPKFNDLNNQLGYRGAKEIISGWAQDFYDKDFKAKTEFQTTFHSTFWELYIHAALKELGFVTSVLHNRPDFIIQQPSELYVEAVVSEISKGGVPETLRTIEDVERNLYPITTREEFSELIDEAIVRHSNSFFKKLKKYRGFEEKGKPIKGYIELDWVDPNKPYIVAICSYDQISYGREFIYSMFALLYGKYFDPLTKSYVIKSSIKKPGTDADIKLGLFNDASYHEVSAVIFSSTLTLGKLASLYKSENPSLDTILSIRHLPDEPRFRLHEVTSDNPEMLLDGLYVFHNPYAKNSLDMELFSRLAQFSCDFHGPYQQGNYPLIVSRYHTNLLPAVLINHLKAETFERFNPEYCARELRKITQDRNKSKKDSVKSKKKRARKIAQASRKRSR
ncbi:hypothetical protein [Cellvibrio sp. PSBB023]|uniref:hypothetical protein n=1 Tax=Cellvibrio sp. PSBB023 TaxID=1945512 RepID=UPI00098F0F30|nr:hypothetical protein [Cellvibrio sp. PSBB023]AQT61880.1 hypothetical protein B0D95_18555 [Cellvibrio sp. PSBB023]